MEAVGHAISGRLPVIALWSKRSPVNRRCCGGCDRGCWSCRRLVQREAWSSSGVRRSVVVPVCAVCRGAVCVRGGVVGRCEDLAPGLALVVVVAAVECAGDDARVYGER